LSKEKFDKKEKIFLILIFTFASIMRTYVGIDYKGAIANTRNIGVVVGSVIGGPFVGFFIGLFAGLHRILIDIHGITSIPCGIATFLGGIISGYCSRLVLKYNSKLVAGILGIIVENMSMIFILIFSRPYELALNIVKNIYVPMVFFNAAGIVIILILLEDIVKEQEKEAGKQIKLAIAIETLPYFRNFGEESLHKVSSIIRKGTGAQLVAITDREKILASSSQDRRFEVYHSNIKSEYTKKVIESGEILESRYEIDNKDLVYNNKEIKSAIIAPLKRNNSVEGTLKIYFSRKN
jgi:two-component system LytT family sensor kinase